MPSDTDTTVGLVLLNIVLYAFAYQLQRPVEPFLIESLSEGADAKTVEKTYGRLQAFFSLAQTVGSPIVGALLDRIGTRYCSVIVFLASALSYAILASATTLSHLFLSKLAATLQAGFLVAQAGVAAATATAAPAVRAAALGRLTTAYTIGATVGPALGGFLGATGDLYRGARIAVGVSLLSALLSLGLPKGGGRKASKTTTGGVWRSFEIARRPNVRGLLLVKVAGSVASSMYGTTYPLVLTQDLGLDAQTLGFFMSASSIGVALLGAFGMAPLVGYFGPRRLARMGLVARAGLVLLFSVLVGFAVDAYGTEQILANRTTYICHASVLHALAAHVLATSLTTQTTGLVAADEQGALLGLEHALFAGARVVGPLLGTSLLADGGVSAVAAVCAVVDLSLALTLRDGSAARKAPDRPGEEVKTN